MVYPLDACHGDTMRAGQLQPYQAPYANMCACAYCSNNLTDLPEDLGEFKYMHTLRLKYNQLKKLPSVVTRLPQLKTLELSGNQISRLDSSISQLTSLKDLDLSGNMLTELPLAIALLPKLEVRQMRHSQSTWLPAIAEPAQQQSTGNAVLQQTVCPIRQFALLYRIQLRYVEKAAAG